MRKMNAIIHCDTLHIIPDFITDLDFYLGKCSAM